MSSNTTSNEPLPPLSQHTQAPKSNLSTELPKLLTQNKGQTHSTASMSPLIPPISGMLRAPELLSGRQVTRQPSLNTFTSFTPSVNDLPYILGKRDFQAAVGCYEDLLDKADKYHQALTAAAEAASEFGLALEESVNTPKVNYNKDVSEGLVNAAALQYVIGTNELILARTVQKSFQKPLQHALSMVKEGYKSNHEYYQQEVRHKTKELRRMEVENIQLSKLKTRNLNAYKANLVQLTNQVDEIDRLKHDYYHEVNSMLEHYARQHLVVKTGSLVRVQLEMYEGVARKGWSGGGLDNLLALSPDLFGTAEGANDAQSEHDDTYVQQEVELTSTLQSPTELADGSDFSLSSPVDTSFDLPKIGEPDLILYRKTRLTPLEQTSHPE